MAARNRAHTHRHEEAQPANHRSEHDPTVRLATREHPDAPAEAQEAEA